MDFIEIVTPYDLDSWDGKFDTYEFIEDENQEYIYTNFREGSNTLEQVDFDGIIYHNLNHKIIFSKFADEFLNSQKDEFEAFVLSKIEDEQQISTIINYKSSFIYISKSPVLKSDSTGEIKGFVITIRKLKLEKFNNDLESYNSFQTTQFDREIMYLDAANLIPSGKFVFFCWGDKIKEKEFPYINDYAKTIYENNVRLGKKLVYVYKKEKTEQGAIDYLQFSNPMQNYKYKNSIINAIKKAFEEFPPSITPYE